MSKESIMSLRKCLIVASMAALVVAAAPAKAAADWLFTPYVGMNWSPQVRFTDALGDLDTELERRANFGASLAWMGAGAAGFELDFGYTPNFFEYERGEDFRFGDSNVVTAMANIVLGAPIGGQSGVGLRPYVAGGVGIIRSRISDPGDLFDVTSNDWGFNVGGGVTAFMSDNFGLRGDVRYFRGLRDNQPEGPLDFTMSDLSFWRASLGATFRF
jgi:opacity protein-like surface antigen